MTNKFINKANLFHNNKFTYPNTNFLNNKTEVKVNCPIHGEFLVLPLTHLKFKTGGCKACADDYLAANQIPNKIIIHDNKYAQVVTTDTVFLNKLRNKLSYKVAGVEYTAAYKNGWNGINYLLDVKGYFLSGLLSQVKEFANNQNFKYIIIDKRKEKTNNYPIDLTQRLQQLNFETRDYQHRIVEAVLKNNKGIVRACTGSGKSLVMGLVTAAFNKPTIIYVIGLDLLQQFHNLFSKIFDEPIGFIGNGVCQIHRINIASIWSISSALKHDEPIVSDEDGNPKEVAPSELQAQSIIKMLEQTKLHILDECHVVNVTSFKNIFKEIDPENIYGFSGTPYRDDGTELLANALLGDQIINVPASELIAQGFLAQPIIKFIKTPKMFIEGGNSYQNIYKEYITNNMVRNNLIVKHTCELLAKGYQVLVLFKIIEHGKTLKKLFDEQNIKYEYLSGSDSLEEREKVKERMASHQSNLILASTVYDIGVDLPSLSGLVLTGGGRSLCRTLQRIGRVIRKYKGKKYACVIDFYDDIKYLKNHSKKRYDIYNSEEGFKLLKISELR